MKLWVLALCLFIEPASASAGCGLEGRIVGVHDGDSITILDADSRQKKVRLEGIDAPELGQPFGRAAKNHLADLAFDKIACAQCAKVDRYGRNVCRVLVDNIDIGLDQLRVGMAWVFTRYARELSPDRRAAYVDAEQGAKTANVGLWNDERPVPPWAWRKERAKGRQAALSPIP